MAIGRKILDRMRKISETTRTKLLTVLLSVVVIGSGGCRTPDPSIGILESELRWLEEQLYVAEDEYLDKQQELERCQRENRALREALEKDSPPAERIDSRDHQQDDEIPDVSGSDERDDSTTIEPQSEESSQSTDQLQPPDVMSFDQIQPTTRLTSDFQEDVASLEDAVVTHITLNGTVTTGSASTSEVEEGILVVIEPRNAAGEYVPISGPIAVTVWEPSQTGRPPLAHWKLNVVQATTTMRQSPWGRGIHVIRPWPERLPKTNRVHVSAHYTTVDERVVKADRTLDVTRAKRVASAPNTQAPRKILLPRLIPTPISSPLATRADVVPTSQSVQEASLILPRTLKSEPRRPRWRPHR